MKWSKVKKKKKKKKRKKEVAFLKFPSVFFRTVGEYPTETRWIWFNRGLPTADPEETPQQEHHYSAFITSLLTHCLLWKQPLLSIHLWLDLKLPVLSISYWGVHSIHRVRQCNMALTRPSQNPWQQQNTRCDSCTDDRNRTIWCRAWVITALRKPVSLLRPFECKHQNTSFVLPNVKCELYLLRKWCPWQWRAPYVPHLFTQSLQASPPCVTTPLS